MERILAERDLAKDVSTRNITVPPMKAVVRWKNAEALKGYDTKREKVILQSLIEKAIAELNDAQRNVKVAFEEFDRKLGDHPAASLEEAEERVKTFETVCRKTTLAQESKVQSAVEAVWAMHQKRDATLTRINLKFAAEITLNAISLTTKLVGALLSLGVLWIAILSAAKTVVSTAMLIKDFAGGRDAALDDVIHNDSTLNEMFEKQGWKGKPVTRELAVAMGVPFVHSIGKMRKKLEDFLGASARLDKERQKLYEQANKLMTDIGKAENDQAGKENATRLKVMGKHTTDLLDQIHVLAGSVDSDNQFYKLFSDQCDHYDTLNFQRLPQTAQSIKLARVAETICSTAKKLVEIAEKLA